jgi:hypothetical protein
MSILRRILGLSVKEATDPGLENKAKETERLIETERQEFRQTLQRADSGARLMQTWDGAMHMMKEKR